ncbi:Tfp pilus assembly protein FimT/FimU [Vreelandella rituensis]|uniref:pilus assembly FimT family protein n=1 Tax=Vreelandella rituensis TaxID=2282306 RepID=UPI0039EF25E1
MFDKPYSKSCTYPKSCNHAQYGLTLIELLVVLSLVAIIATWGIPSFQALGGENRTQQRGNANQEGAFTGTQYGHYPPEQDYPLPGERKRRCL